VSPTVVNIPASRRADPFRNVCYCGDLQAYALPALFCLKLSGPRLPLPRWQALVCYGLIPLAVALSGVGLASSLTDLYQKLAHRFMS
jgi:hypothetical protein